MDIINGVNVILSVNSYSLRHHARPHSTWLNRGPRGVQMPNLCHITVRVAPGPLHVFLLDQPVGMSAVTSCGSA